MRRLLTALSTRSRLSAAADFLRKFAGQEILVIGETRTATDELVRGCSLGTSGVFGAHRFTLAQLAFALASEKLAEDGQSFITGVAMDAMAARAVHSSVAKGELPWFGPVARTPGFFRALAETLQELRLNRIDPQALPTAGPSGNDLRSLLASFDESLSVAEAADAASAFRIATEVARRADFRFAGRALLFLDLFPASLLEEEFLRALCGAASDVLATAHTRDSMSVTILERALGIQAEFLNVADPVRALDRLRTFVFEADAPASSMDDSVQFQSATDESRECVEIARAILARAASGAPFDGMAVVLRNPELYQPPLEDALRRAKIPALFTRGSRRPNAAGRALLALLACAAEGLSAARFSEYLSLGQAPGADAPPPRWVPVQGELFPDIRPSETAPDPATAGVDDAAGEQDSSPVDEHTPIVAGSVRAPHHWERLLVDAAVIGGRNRWARRLTGLANELARRIEEVDGESESTRLYLERQLERLGALRAFALPLIEFLDGLPESATWDEWLNALEELARRALRQPEFVVAALAEIRPMGNLGPATLDEVREVLTHRLSSLRNESPERRYGKVFVTTAAELAGLSFDVVFLPGLAEDTFPQKAFEDPLLLDDARERVSSWLATQNTRVARERRLLHVAAGAAESALWISYPRMDLGQGRARNPSFYALDVLRAVKGNVPTLAELQQQSSHQTQSHAGWPAPRDPAAAIDDAEYDLAVIGGLLRLPAAESVGKARYLITANPNLGRSLRARAGRWRGKWVEADGIVGPDSGVVEALAPWRPITRPYSATALQQFAACPYKFALYAIHRIQPREATTAIERMDPLTRGSLFHAVQFRLLSELRDRNLLPITTDVSALADVVFNQVAASFEEDLAPAIPRIWDSQVEDVRWDLRGWLREMADPANGSWTPRWFELAFGLPGSADRDPASSDEPVDIGNGVRARGAIDMVEEREGRLRVTDHKTGKAPLRPPGLTGGGEVLQPTIYAQAAEALLGKRVQSARLFYATERGRYQSFEIPIDDHSRSTLASVIGCIDKFIADGFLPAAPRAEACAYCDYRPVCGPYEESRIRRKAPDRLAPLKTLREMP